MPNQWQPHSLEIRNKINQTNTPISFSIRQDNPTHCPVNGQFLRISTVGLNFWVRIAKLGQRSIPNKIAKIRPEKHKKHSKKWERKKGFRKMVSRGWNYQTISNPKVKMRGIKKINLLNCSNPMTKTQKSLVPIIRDVDEP